MSRVVMRGGARAPRMLHNTVIVAYTLSAMLLCGN